MLFIPVSKTKQSKTKTGNNLVFLISDKNKWMFNGHHFRFVRHMWPKKKQTKQKKAMTKSMRLECFQYINVVTFNWFGLWMGLYESKKIQANTSLILYNVRIRAITSQHTYTTLKHTPAVNCWFVCKRIRNQNSVSVPVFTTLTWKKKVFTCIQVHPLENMTLKFIN